MRLIPKILSPNVELSVPVTDVEHMTAIGCIIPNTVHHDISTDIVLNDNVDHPQIVVCDDAITVPEKPVVIPKIPLRRVQRRWGDSMVGDSKTKSPIKSRKKHNRRRTKLSKISRKNNR